MWSTTWFAIGVAAVAATPQDSTRFRGSDGISTFRAGHPTSWDAERNISWEVEVDGEGWSSPIVIGDRVYLTSAVADDATAPVGFQRGVSTPETRGQPGAPPSEPMSFTLECRALDDGALHWSRVVVRATPRHPKHPSNTWATESPASDGERVFVHFGAAGVIAAYTLDGELVWSEEIGAYPMNAGFGTGSSLATFDGHVFVQSDNERRSFLLALDATSGEERWRADRGRGSGWSSPVIWPRERPELIACGPGKVTSYDPATGETWWELTGFSGSFTASPTFDHERLYFGNSGPTSRGPLMSLDGGADGEFDVVDAEDRESIWIAPRSGPGFASPVVVGDRIYVNGSGGVLACHDATSGERLYRTRLPGAATVVACPWVVGDLIFILDETGKTFVVRDGPEHELVRTNALDGLFWSTPCVSGGALLLRSVNRLICIRHVEV